MYPGRVYPHKNTPIIDGCRLPGWAPPFVDPFEAKGVYSCDNCLPRIEKLAARGKFKGSKNHSPLVKWGGARVGREDALYA
jgi:hypothetical protein